MNSHFAAHMEKVNSRNSDFEYCYNQMAFGPKPVPTAVGGNGMQKSLASTYKCSFPAPDFHVVQCLFIVATESASSCMMLLLRHAWLLRI